MVDIPWPSDLFPYRVLFYLQPHVGGSESPLTRVRKVYGLSAPRWVARLTFRSGVDGAPRFHEQDGFGPRLDALIADLEGGVNLAVFHDFRRPRPLQPISVMGPLVSTGAARGATSMTVTGLARGSVAMSVGDYVAGGDGRPHMVSAAATIAAGGVVNGAGSIMADTSGKAIIGFKPPLFKAMAAGTTLKWPVTGRFQIVDPDAAGQNEVEVGTDVEHVLDFVEDLR